MQPSDIGTLIALADKLGPWLTLIALAVFWYFKYGRDGKQLDGKQEIMENCKTQVATCKERFNKIDEGLEKGGGRFELLSNQLHKIDTKIAIISTHLGINGNLK